MSQNRQEAKDRLRSEHDYRVNLKAELEIRLLHKQTSRAVAALHGHPDLRKCTWPCGKHSMTEAPETRMESKISEYFEAPQPPAEAAFYDRTLPVPQVH